MSDNKTVENDGSVAQHLANISHPQRREDSMALDAIFREVTGWSPRLWGDSLIGYGRYHYRYDSGREGDFLATGFAARASNLSIYIMPGYTDFSDILADLGPHKLGKACLYVTRLSRIELDPLKRLIRAGLTDLETRWPVEPT